MEISARVFDKAVLIVERQMRHTVFEQSGNADIAKRTEQALQQTLDEVLSSSESEDVLAALPEAERYVKEREAREEFIDNQTFLGHLRHSLIVLGAMQHDKVPMTRELLPKPSDVGLDARQYAYEEFAQLLLELDGAKSKPLLDALQGVLSSVRTDILFQSEDMPPVPQLPELV